MNKYLLGLLSLNAHHAIIHATVPSFDIIAMGKISHWLPIAWHYSGTQNMPREKKKSLKTKAKKNKGHIICAVCNLMSKPTLID